eukprot:CAMPEP_0184671642 /NCGR_PEP_ID=MMETSP0308-20130426/85625_1 /TAXON_ID=38269 /ORGANISM="Gloeochaete witrockiana, Strain SAG 46.84" /LENGTH=538 /DNA_ID=CAMNT_0027118813 /DNA_START=2512 /DNA_END=4128 /DNA_ORIENTATION=-
MADGVVLLGDLPPGSQSVLSRDALFFVASLHREFDGTRQKQLLQRRQRQKEIDEGKWPDFLPVTKWIRDSEWQVRGPIAQDLEDRRVEITGPVERKMIVNALNSGAKVFMADFEDSNSPTWHNNVRGQINLRDAVAGTISVEEKGKKYTLNAKTATLMVRPRGWHLDEAHMEVDGAVVSASLFDFGIFFFNNARALVKKGSTIAFYCPKMESHLEARLWNDVFSYSEKAFGLPVGSIKATCLIETIFGAFEMEEILYELRDHSAGLNCGRWDYIFSFIKKFRKHRSFIVPDRAVVTMEQHFLKSYVELLIKVCHRRACHAMGGMAANIPVRGDAAATNEAFNKVRKDKLREVLAGHDGTWVAHPALVPVALEVFNEHMKGPHQLHVRRDDVRVTPADLLKVPVGKITEKGVREDIQAALLYLQSWLLGTGAVAINHLMEDAATAEIALMQLWQWTHHQAMLDDGRHVNPGLVKQMVREEVEQIRKRKQDDRSLSALSTAVKLLEQRTSASHESLSDFVTLDAYQFILQKKRTLPKARL